MSRPQPALARTTNNSFSFFGGSFHWTLPRNERRICYLLNKHFVFPVMAAGILPLLELCLFWKEWPKRHSIFIFREIVSLVANFFHFSGTITFLCGKIEGKLNVAKKPGYFPFGCIFCCFNSPCDGYHDFFFKFNENVDGLLLRTPKIFWYQKLISEIQMRSQSPRFNTRENDLLRFPSPKQLSIRVSLRINNACAIHRFGFIINTW